MSFANLGLSEKVQSAVAATGYTTPTPIQQQAIPHVLARQDVLGIAQTGTGKTAAFVLPMITMLEQGRARARMPRTLILEPTRELAAQVAENFVKYGTNHKLSMALLIGGVQMGDQVKALKDGVDVLIDYTSHDAVKANAGQIREHREMILVDSDPRKLLATLEKFRSETMEAGRKAFVTALASDHKIAATQSREDPRARMLAPALARGRGAPLPGSRHPGGSGRG